MILRVRPLQFEFRALDPVHFPPGSAANTFRGAFGEIFRSISCDPACPGASNCPKAPACAYARMFEPRILVGAGPSGLHDAPRPFVLRAASLDSKRFEPGQRFSLGVNIFDLEAPALEYFRLAFSKLGDDGLGPGRPRVELTSAIEMKTESVDLSRTGDTVTRIALEFLTPTQLKLEGEPVLEPRFDVLLKRARDRVTTLIGLYQAGPVSSEFDFRGLAQRAGSVRLTASRIAQVETFRRSKRTGERHGTGGFTGDAEYEGGLAEFLPWLEALWWTGVGRLTVWGNGLVRVRR